MGGGCAAGSVQAGLRLRREVRERHATRRIIFSEVIRAWGQGGIWKEKGEWYRHEKRGFWNWQKGHRISIRELGESEEFSTTEAKKESPTEEGGLPAEYTGGWGVGCGEHEGGGETPGVWLVCNLCLLPVLTAVAWSLTNEWWAFLLSRKVLL